MVVNMPDKKECDSKHGMMGVQTLLVPVVQFLHYTAILLAVQTSIAILYL